jgi:hypothetical protein
MRNSATTTITSSSRWLKAHRSASFSLFTVAGRAPADSFVRPLKVGNEARAVYRIVAFPFIACVRSLEL